MKRRITVTFFVALALAAMAYAAHRIDLFEFIRRMHGG